MAKFTVWQCDRCRERVIRNNSPEGWVQAVINTIPEPVLRLTEIIADRLWCRNCWTEVGAALPEKAGK